MADRPPTPPDTRDPVGDNAPAGHAVTAAAPQAGNTSEATPDRIEAKLRATHQRQRQYVHTRAIARLVIAALLAGAVSWLLDWSLRLDTPGRLLLLAANIALLGYIGWRDWYRRLESYDPAALALRVEKAHPELRSLLISYVQFRVQADAQAQQLGVSTRLLTAARRQAEHLTAALDFRAIVPMHALRDVLLLAAALLTLAVMAAVIWPDHVRTLAHRLVNPFAAVTYPTRTRIETITGDRAVRKGDPLTLTVTAAGLVPQHGELLTRPAPDRPWEPAAIENDGRGTFDYRLPEVHQSFDYHARIGDDRSGVYRVRVIEAPRIVEAEVRAEYPPQVPRDAETLEGLNHRVPEGTELTWRVTFDRPLESLDMLRIDRDVAPTAGQPEGDTTPIETARLTDNPAVAAAALTVRRDLHYRLLYRDAAHGFAYDDPVEYSIRITPDQPPTVEVIEPAALETVATVNKTLDVAYQAGDDFGLTRATLHYSLNDDDPRRRVLAEYDRRAVTDRFTWTPRRDLPQLAEGDVVTWWLTAADNHADEPKVGESARRRIEIVSVADYQQTIYERIEALTEELEQVREQEGEAAERIEQLRKRQAEPEPTQSP